MMYSDFEKATAPKAFQRSLDTCQHKHLEHIGYVMATTSKGDVRSYEAFCADCNEMVYCQTGGIRVPWTVNKSVAFTNE